MPLLIVREPGQVAISVPVTGGLVIGRDEASAVVVADHKVSRRHARFDVTEAGVEIEDTGSTHGTLVNGARVERQLLRDGDRIQIGSTLITFVEREAAETLDFERVTTEAAPATAEGAERRLRLFYELGRAIGRGGDTDELLGSLLDAVLDVLGGQRCVAGVRAEGGEGLRRIVRTRGQHGGDELVLSRALLDAMLVRREGVVVRASAERSPTLVQHRILSAIGAPLRSGPRVVGFLYADDREHPERFGAADLSFLIALGHLAGAAIESAERLQRVEAAAEALGASDAVAELVGQSAPMVKLKAQVQKYGASGASVLVLGESGTGKELVARSIHAASARADRPFVAVNCAAIPDTMIESELFGHLKGAFTGAAKARRGKFALADRGTLFLDEIGDLSLAAQAKVLRALQEGEIVPLGAEAPAHVDVRVVAATHKSLREEIAARRFRDDLYYRLKVVELCVPPLRERGDDIVLLARAMLPAAALRVGKRIEGFSAAALVALRGHRWPGNVRELENEVEHAAIVTDAAIIDVDDLSRDVTAGRRGALSAGHTLTLVERFAALEPTERQLVEEALEAARGNVSEAARALGITRIMMKRRMDRFGLGGED